jgi:uncharacterized protein YyaL (SSP411 family)
LAQPPRPADAACAALPSNATDKVGGIAFYSTQDADSEGEEGKSFVWTPDEIRAVLGDEAEPFMAAYGVTEDGNFEGKNILELEFHFESSSTSLWI